MSLRARVSFVKRVAAGDGISYGLRHTFDAPTTVATIPIGYADGVARRLASVGGVALIGGRRCPIVGTVTMDQLMVDVGDAPVAVGDEAVLLGSQGSERVTAEEWGDRPRHHRVRGDVQHLQAGRAASHRGVSRAACPTQRAQPSVMASRIMHGSCCSSARRRSTRRTRSQPPSPDT
jgi:hypothetical protein